jgi:hypothetical protein
VCFPLLQAHLGPSATAVQGQLRTYMNAGAPKRFKGRHVSPLSFWSVWHYEFTITAEKWNSSLVPIGCTLMHVTQYEILKIVPCYLG